MDKTLFFLHAKCVSTGRDFYIRHDFAADDRWVLTYGLKDIPYGESLGSGHVTADYTNARLGPQYKCPHCGNLSFLRCCKCHQYICYGDDPYHAGSCPSCGNIFTPESIRGRIESVESNSSGSGQ